jgi:hypothetical protein
MDDLLAHYRDLIIQLQADAADVFAAGSASRLLKLEFRIVGACSRERFLKCAGPRHSPANVVQSVWLMAV